MTQDAPNHPRTSEDWAHATRRTNARVSPPNLRCDQGQLVDISLGGAMLRTKRRLRAPLVLRIATPGACLGLPARVVWHRPICFRDHEYGVEFHSLTPRLRLMLQDLVGPLPATAPENDAYSAPPLEVHDPQLAQLVRLWPHLVDAQRHTILAMLRAA